MDLLSELINNLRIDLQYCFKNQRLNINRIYEPRFPWSIKYPEL